MKTKKKGNDFCVLLLRCWLMERAKQQQMTYSYVSFMCWHSSSIHAKKCVWLLFIYFFFQSLPSSTPVANLFNTPRVWRYHHQIFLFFSFFFFFFGVFFSFRFLLSQQPMPSKRHFRLQYESLLTLHISAAPPSFFFCSVWLTIIIQLWSMNELPSSGCLKSELFSTNWWPSSFVLTLWKIVK